MADYKVTDTELISIANAIRTKGGTQAQLEFPTGFVSAVQAIPTGGGQSSFEGDGREYLFDWAFQGNKGFIHVSKDGTVNIINGDDEINGDLLYKQANSQVITAKKNCYVKTGNTSSIGSETQISANDTISSSISGYERLIVAYEQSGQISDYEICMGWSISVSGGYSAQRCILKVGDIIVPQAVSVMNGDCFQLAHPSSVAQVTMLGQYVGNAYGFSINYNFKVQANGICASSSSSPSILLGTPNNGSYIGFAVLNS